MLGFAGAREDVQWQLQKAKELGLHDNANLDHEKTFWEVSNAGSVYSRSVLPSRLIETLRELGPISFVARAGNGVLHHRGGAAPAKNADLPLALMQRMKQTYDPKNILPEFAL